MQKSSYIKPVYAVILLQLLFITGEVKAQAPPSSNCALIPPSITKLNQKLNLSSPIDDFISRNQRQYESNIRMMNEQVASLDSTYERHSAIIKMLEELVTLRLQQVDNKLYAQQSLSDYSNHCVRQNNWKLKNPADLKKSISNCPNSYRYTYTLTNIRNTLNSHYTTDLVKALNDCKNSTLTENYNSCVIKAIAVADDTTVRYMADFQNELKNNECTDGNRIRTSLTCTFKAAYDAIYEAGAVTARIDACLEDEKLLRYTSPPLLPSPDAYCHNQKTLSDNSTATIRNPFYGYRGNATCILMRFQNPQITPCSS